MDYKNNKRGRRAFNFGLGASIAAVTMDRFGRQLRAFEISQRDFSVDNSVGNARSLKVRLASKGLPYGAATRYSILSTDLEFASLFAQECAFLVPEWELKWGILRPAPDQFDFARADWLAQFAIDRGMLFRGHTLVWHEDLPGWFQSTVTASNAEQVLRNHIQTVVKRYAGGVHSWDVVNEAIQDSSGGRSDGLRNTPWLEFLGPRYIDLAFQIAAEADPNALLVYNDFGLEYDTPEDDAKRIAVFKLLENLKARGIPVQALGMQSHLGGEAPFNPEKLRSFLSAVAGLGLKILITELDVTDQNLPVDSAQRDLAIAATYEDYLSVVLQEPAVIAVLTWGLSDRYTWLSAYAARADRAPVRTLPYDENLQPKLAWNAMARAFDRAPLRSSTLDDDKFWS